LILYRKSIIGKSRNHVLEFIFELIIIAAPSPSIVLPSVVCKGNSRNDEVLASPERKCSAN